MTDIIHTPRKGSEMLEASGDVPMYMYSSLCKDMLYKGAFNMFTSIMMRKGKIILLLQNPRKMNSGHWMGVKMNPKKREIYFFSSYGGRPDEEKNEWIDLQGQLESGQATNPLNDALKQYHQMGWKIMYNDFPYQHEGDDTATCGIWTVAFLNSDLDPDQFANVNRKYGLDANYYYRKYFLKE